MKDVNQEAQKVEIVPFEENVIAQAFREENGVANLFEEMKSKVASLVFDAEDPIHRAEMKSLAYAISRSKTAVDDFGKDLVSGIKAQAKIIDSQRKDWRESCDELRDSVRAPLTQWEQEQEAKLQIFKDRLAEIEAIRDADYTGKYPEAIQATIAHIKGLSIDEENFDYLVNESKLARFEALEILESALVASEEYKKQREEAQKAYDEKIRAEALAQAEAKAEKERQDAEARIAQAEARALQAEQQAKAKAEAQKLQEEQAEAQRRADKEHRDAVLMGIVEAICASGVADEDTAKAITKMAFKGEIPNLKIIF